MSVLPSLLLMLSWGGGLRAALLPFRAASDRADVRYGRRSWVRSASFVPSRRKPKPSPSCFLAGGRWSLVLRNTAGGPSFSSPNQRRAWSFLAGIGDTTHMRKDLAAEFAKKDKYAPAIILVEPKTDENLGAVARAMLNFNLWDLRIVNIQCNHLSERALFRSCGADEVLKSARLFDSLPAACGDLTRTFATTNRLRAVSHHFVMTPYGAAREIDRLAREQERETGEREAGEGERLLGCCGIIFGSERLGLSNEDCHFADGTIQIPTSPLFSSLNLAQAVTLVAYELFSQRSFHVKEQVEALGYLKRSPLNPFCTKATTGALKAPVVKSVVKPEGLEELEPLSDPLFDPSDGHSSDQSVHEPAPGLETGAGRGNHMGIPLHRDGLEGSVNVESQPRDLKLEGREMREPKGKESVLENGNLVLRGRGGERRTDPPMCVGEGERKGRGEVGPSHMSLHLGKRDGPARKGETEFLLSSLGDVLSLLMPPEDEAKRESERLKRERQERVIAAMLRRSALTQGEVRSMIAMLCRVKERLQEVETKADMR